MRNNVANLQIVIITHFGWALVLAWKERLLADHLVNDPDDFAKKKSMSLRSSCCSVSFAMINKSTKPCRGRNSGDKLVHLVVQSSSNPRK